MKCIKCGKDLPDDALFCISCGTKQESKSAITIEQKPQDCQEREIASADVPKEDLSHKNIEILENNYDKEVLTKPKKDNTIIWIIAIVCALGLGIRIINANMERKKQELLDVVLQKRNEKISETPITSNSSVANSQPVKVSKELKEIVDGANENFPSEVEDGITIKKCLIDGDAFIYLVEWEGLSPDDFTNEAIRELRDDVFEGMKGEGDVFSKYLFKRLKKCGCTRIGYKYINEKGAELCSFTYLIDDL